MLPHSFDFASCFLLQHHWYDFTCNAFFKAMLFDPYSDFNESELPLTSPTIFFFGWMPGQSRWICWWCRPIRNDRRTFILILRPDFLAMPLQSLFLIYPYSWSWYTPCLFSPIPPVSIWVFLWCQPMFIWSRFSFLVSQSFYNRKQNIRFFCL